MTISSVACQRVLSFSSSASGRLPFENNLCRLMRKPFDSPGFCDFLLAQTILQGSSKPIDSLTADEDVLSQKRASPQLRSRLHSGAFTERGGATCNRG